MGMLVFGVFRALSSGSALQRAAYDLQVVSTNLGEGQSEAAERSLRFAQENARAARDQSDGPFVWLASKAPFIGNDVSAVRLTAQVVDDLARDTLPDMAEAAKVLTPDSLRPRSGQIRLAPIKQAEPALSLAADEVRAARDRVARINVDELSGKLQSPMRQMQTQLAAAAALARKGALAAHLLPRMLGDDGPRTYALITQNNAEIRSTGGIPGSVAIIRTDDGRIEMVKQGNEGEFGFGWPGPVVPVTPEELALYGDGIAQFPQSVNFTPHFPRSAEILHAMWLKRHDESLDGVLSVDPVAMAHILGGTGPVRYNKNKDEVTQANIVAGVENLMYLVFPQDAGTQDDVFADIGRAVFNAVVAGRGAPAEVLDALTTATNEGRVMIWSARPEEQELIEDTRISGAMPTEASERPQLGVFLNDTLSDKMSYYLKYAVDVEVASCNSDGSQSLDVQITMTSLAPPNVSDYAHLLSARDHPKQLLGVISNAVNVYAPFGGRVTEVRLKDGGEVAANDDLTHLGRQVTSFGIDLDPGQTQVVQLKVLTGKNQPAPVELRTSPAALGPGWGKLPTTACN